MTEHASVKELELRAVTRRGDTGEGVKRIQEWLCLNGVRVVIDGRYGAATEAAVRRYQATVAVAEDGVVSPDLFKRLVLPMRRALDPIPVNGRSLRELVVAHAQQHLAQHPREVGGQNRGPWVRLYLGGREGTQWAWCAGFVCFCLRQACDALGIAPPIQPSFSCDSLAASARKESRFLPEGDRATGLQLAAGSLFLVRRSAHDWTHTGIVTAVSADHFDTIEGNTNDDGSREGYEVCARVRDYGGKDFVVI